MMKSLKICLQLLMLLGRLIYNQSVMQHCLLESTFPNFTAVAGSPFYFNILRPTMKQRRDLQISLTSGNPLPSWVVYTHHSGYLVGLALAEDSGIHHLQIKVINHNCTADFYVHVLNTTVDSVQRDISVWGSLLLEVDPVSLNASQRIHLVNTVSAFFQLQRESISLISNTNVLPHKTICQPINSKDKDFERDATAGKITQLVWPLRCRSHTQLSFLQDEFETSVLAKQLHVPVFAWRFLCNNKAAQKVKRDLKDQLLSPNVTSRGSFNVPTLPAQPTSVIDIEQGFITSAQNTLEETNSKTLNNLQSNSIAKASSLSYGRSESVMSTLSSFEQNITPLILTASSAVMHGITELQRLPTSLTLRRDLEASAIWTHMYGYSHSESSGRAHMKSQDFSEFRPDFSSPSVSETFVVSFNTDKSSQSSKAILLTWTYSPSNIYLSQTSITEQYGQSVPPTVSGESHQETSQLNVVSDASLATLESQTAQNELESSMHFSFTIEPTASMYTPPLPSGYITSGQSWTYSNNLPFTVYGESISQTFSTNEFMGSQLEPELTFGSGLCFDQVNCPASSSTADDWQMFSSTFQGIKPMMTISKQQIYSMLLQSSFINRFSESNHVSPHVSLHSSSAHAYLSATPASTVAVSPSVTYSDQISTNDIFPTISKHLGTRTPSSVWQIVSSATIHFPEMSNALYATALLTGWQPDATQGVLSTTYEILPNTSNANMSPATMVSQMTENSSEDTVSSSFSNREPTESIFTSSLTYEHSTRLQWTLENISPTVIVQSVQEFSHVTRQSDLSLETQVKADRSDIFCYGQSGLRDCSGSLVTSETEFQTLSSAFERSRSISATGMIEENEQSSFLIPSFTDLSNIQTYELFTAFDSQYEVASSAYFSNTQFATLGPIEKSSSDYLASETYATASYIEEMAPSTVHSPSTESTVYLFESLDPSFPLCPSMEFSLCASTVGGIFTATTVESFIDGNTNSYRTSYFGDSAISEVESGGQSLSTTWQRGSGIVEFSAFNSKGSSLETYATVLASSSVQLSPNYSSATHQMPPDTWTPSYMTSLSVLTYTLSPLGSSALIGHCDTDSGSLLKCQSSAQATVGPAKQSASFKLYSVVSTALLASVGHSSHDIVRPSPSSVIATSSINFPPEVSRTIPALTATVGFPFLYSISQNTFVDPEDGAAHALSLKMTLIDPPPPSVGSWLSLDGLELHGIALEIDTHYAPQRVLLSARDKGGLTASIPFTVELYRDPLQPCHVFTLTVRLSLHSLLLHRQKMELFLTKISNYFNATSYRRLAIVAIAPGSTVVSWYNRSLCDNGQCHYEDINSMWLAMGFENGVVNSKFRHVMLPEFPVVNVEPVSYREDCISFTQTPPISTHTTTSEQDTTSNLSTSTPITTTSKQTASFDKMAAMFIALLVICCLILIVLIIAAILYFCQKRPRVVAIFPSSRMLSVRSRDLSALRPRPAPLLHPEIPPPLPRLWISLEQDDDPQPPEIHERNGSEPRRLPTKYKFSNI